MRGHRREAVLVEIWDWFDDVGASLRSLDSKRDALSARLNRQSIAADWKVSCLFVVRRTRRNERLVADLRPLFAARFRGSAHAWLAALSRSDRDMPAEAGLLWSTSSHRLQPSRLATGSAHRDQSPID
jgi:hypothetical protein